MKNLVIVVVFVVMLASVAFAQSGQSVTFHQPNGGTSTWTPPAAQMVKTPCYGTVPRANGPVVRQLQSQWPSQVSAPMPPVVGGTTSADPSGVASLRGGIVAARPVPSGNPEVDRDNNQTDLQWGQLAAERERSNQQADLERVQIERQYDIQRREESRQTVQTLANVIQNWQDGQARREDSKASRRIEANWQAQNAAQQAADRASQLAQTAMSAAAAARH